MAELGSWASAGAGGRVAKVGLGVGWNDRVSRVGGGHGRYRTVTVQQKLFVFNQ